MATEQLLPSAACAVAADEQVPLEQDSTFLVCSMLVGLGVEYCCTKLLPDDMICIY